MAENASRNDTLSAIMPIAAQTNSHKESQLHNMSSDSSQRMVARRRRLTTE